MFSNLKTLFDGAQARAEDRLRDHYSIELIDQKIREAEAGLVTAKRALASLIQREACERRQLAGLQRRIEDLTERTRYALSAAREDLAQDAAQAIARLENEKTARSRTLGLLETKVLHLRQSVESAQARVLDLKQGAVSVRAARRAAAAQARLGPTLDTGSALDEAASLIERALSAGDPFASRQILEDIEAGLGGADITDRMAQAGFGAPTKSSTDAVLTRLRAELPNP